MTADDAARACDRGPCHKERGHAGRCNPGGDAWPEDRQREAVARAIWVAGDRGPWANAERWDREHYLDLADAALSALTKEES